MHQTISDFLLEVVQNSLEAGADRIGVLWQEISPRLSFSVADNGSGMDPDQLERLDDPFFTDGKKHRRRKVGLGIPFLAQILEMTGGSYDVKSEPGIGTKVSCVFRLDHIDTPPVGDVITAFGSIITMDGGYELTLRRVLGEAEYALSRSELRDALGDLESIDSQVLLQQYLRSCEEELLE